MKQLTDNMIKNAFDELAVDNKYFDKFKEVAEYYYSELQRDCPDDDEDNSNADESIRFSKEFMKYYVPEKEKGHCDIWAETYANCRTHWLKEYKSYRNAYNALEEKEHPEKELDIHVASMSTDPLFRERYEYKFLCSEIECDPKEAAALYHFLASDDCRYITGEDIYIDGGKKAGPAEQLLDSILKSLEM